ncbi:hypothetical protein H6503_02655 [Candidatus Woesearchaeota archaeon]|nr:hypothetical protein [Candidatus Woesearchaeota archaeon]
MKKIKRLELEAITAAVLFLFMIFSTTIFSNSSPITGFAIYESTEDAQSAVQQFFRKDIFQSIEPGAKMCINIRNDTDEYYTFAVRKRGSVFDVEPAEFYCDGKNNEDWVFTFKDHSQLELLNNLFDISNFKRKTDNQYFEVWLSKYVKDQDTVSCDQDFKDTYCEFINTNYRKSEQKTLGITCCLDVKTENPAGNWFIDFIEGFWWLIALVIVCIIVGTGAIVLLSSKDDEIDDSRKEDQEDDNLRQIKTYISESQKNGNSNEMIRESLIEVGWQQGDIDEAFEQVRIDGMMTLEERFEKSDLRQDFNNSVQ